MTRAYNCSIRFTYLMPYIVEAENEGEARAKMQQIIVDGDFDIHTAYMVDSEVEEVAEER